MKEKSKDLKKIVATIFGSINEKNVKQGINAQYKYTSGPVEIKTKDTDGIEEIEKGWEVSIIMSEMGYKDTTLQTFGFKIPKGVDKFSIEYNAFIMVLSSLTETALITWVQLGNNLNKDTKFQKEAINSLHDDKETNKDTNK